MDVATFPTIRTLKGVKDSTLKCTEKGIDKIKLVFC